MKNKLFLTVLLLAALVAVAAYNGGLNNWGTGRRSNDWGYGGGR